MRYVSLNGVVVAFSDYKSLLLHFGIIFINYGNAKVLPRGTYTWREKKQ
jgi:hypothetical protein